MGESSELPTLRKILCVLLLKGLADGLVCNMHQCTSYDKDIGIYHGTKALIIKGTINQSCETEIAYSLNSSTVQGQLANTTVQFSPPGREGSLISVMISYRLQEDLNNIADTVSPTPTADYISSNSVKIVKAVDVRVDSRAIDIIILYSTLNTTTIERKIYNDTEHFDTSKTQDRLAKEIIKNNQTFADRLSVDISPHECRDNLSLSLCSCEEPVITKLSHADNTLTCEGAGYPVDNLTVSWSIDGIGLSAEEPKRNRDSDTIISEIKDIPIPDSLTQYTCEIYNSVTNKSISESIPREMFPTQENDV